MVSVEPLEVQEKVKESQRQRAHVWTFLLGSSLTFLLVIGLLHYYGIGWMASLPIALITSLLIGGIAFLAHVYVQGPIQLTNIITNEEEEPLCRNSVGRIFAGAKNRFDTDKYVTAFYIGQPTMINGTEVHKLLTVAHAYYDMFNKKHLVFIPSFYNGDKDDIYSVYTKKGGIRRHPEFQPFFSKLLSLLAGEPYEHCTHYDVCVVFIIPNKKDINLIPLQLVVRNDYSTKTTMRVIGYSMRREGCSRIVLLTYYSKPHVISAQYIPSHTIKYYHPLTIRIAATNFARFEGMSGGPWVISSNNEYFACGIQSCIISNSNITIDGQSSTVVASATFREDIFKELNLDYVKVSS